MALVIEHVDKGRQMGLGAFAQRENIVDFLFNHGKEIGIGNKAGPVAEFVEIVGSIRGTLLVQQIIGERDENALDTRILENSGAHVVEREVLLAHNLSGFSTVKTLAIVYNIQKTMG